MEALYTILNEKFRLDEFRPRQKEIITHIMAGNNALVIMPTGGGKSLCYQLPALLMPGLTVVISPLIALMKDQVQSLQSKGIDAEFINSSLTKAERVARYTALAQGQYKIIYVSPERFRKRAFALAISKRQVSLLALDEAHCVSQWGNDFRPDYTRIAEYRQLLGNPPIVALTASATETVRREIIAHAGLSPRQITIFNSGIARPNLYLSAKTFYSEREKFEAIKLLIEKCEGCCIVYFTLITGIEKFASYLDIAHIPYDVYHGRLPAQRRRSVQDKFIAAKRGILLATNAFGLGVDKGDIRMVVHAEIPDSVESYFQEIGRSGRDGTDAFCHLMYLENDLAVQMQFIEWKNPSRAFLKQAYTLFQNLGDRLNAHDYESIQEMLVYRNRGDRRLDSVLNIFDRYGITAGSLETHNLALTGEFNDDLFSDEVTEAKLASDRKKLYFMLEYVKSELCRRSYIHRYFASEEAACVNCDNCIS